ncbi:hypothetical protein [Micromonospora zamorensis]|uniref:hypothetical protein n=1 Tax=Micromonospora zamorensis TaxID=709883 RepID=UPI00378E7B02
MRDDLAVKMHADQLDVSAEVVAALVAEQFPEWRALPVRPLPSTGGRRGSTPT